MDGPFFPDPDEAGGDGSLVGVFLLVLGIMIGLTVVIYVSGLWQAAGKLVLDVLGN